MSRRLQTEDESNLKVLRAIEKQLNFTKNPHEQKFTNRDEGN